MAISTELAAELNAVLARLRAARAKDPKHGTLSGAPDCGEDCDICFTEHHFNYLIDQIPRGPVGTVLDGVIPGEITIEGSVLGEALSAAEGDVHVTPTLGVQFIAPWSITREPDAP